MTPQMVARVDGLPVRLLERRRVFPQARGVSRARREREQRQTLVVRQARIPRWLAVEIEADGGGAERQEIRQALREGGLL